MELSPGQIRKALIERLCLAPASVQCMSQINFDSLGVLEQLVSSAPLSPDPERKEAHRYENALAGRTLFDEGTVVKVLRKLSFKRMRTKRFKVLLGRLWRSPCGGALAYKRWGPYHSFAISVFYLPGDSGYRYYDQSPPKRGKKK